MKGKGMMTLFAIAESEIEKGRLWVLWNGRGTFFLLLYRLNKSRHGTKIHFSHFCKTKFK